MDYTYNQDMDTNNTIDNQLCLQVDYNNRSDYFYIPPNTDITNQKITVVNGLLYLNDIMDDGPMWCMFFDSDIGIQTIDTYECDTDVGMFDTWDFNVLNITIYNINDINCGCNILNDIFYDNDYFDNNDNQ